MASGRPCAACLNHGHACVCHVFAHPPLATASTLPACVFLRKKVHPGARRATMPRCCMQFALCGRHFVLRFCAIALLAFFCRDVMLRQVSILLLFIRATTAIKAACQYPSCIVHGHVGTLFRQSCGFNEAGNARRSTCTVNPTGPRAADGMCVHVGPAEAARPNGGVSCPVCVLQLAARHVPRVLVLFGPCLGTYAGRRVRALVAGTRRLLGLCAQ